ncbi:MAG: glutaredoxin family protein [Cyanobacteria bacterium J083]|nr:MAG: glutaredoxin family protein [Cyanobacteria bacterium J083]
MKLILYSKPGCHLCEGLEEKLAAVQEVKFELEIRDITSREEWFAAYQYEIPVLCVDLEGKEQALPRLSPRSSVKQLETMLKKNLTKQN